jgi:hypothetical protein
VVFDGFRQFLLRNILFDTASAPQCSKVTLCQSPSIVSMQVLTQVSVEQGRCHGLQTNHWHCNDDSGFVSAGYAAGVVDVIGGLCEACCAVNVATAGLHTVHSSDGESVVDEAVATGTFSHFCRQKKKRRTPRCSRNERFLVLLRYVN